MLLLLDLHLLYIYIYGLLPPLLPCLLLFGSLIHSFVLLSYVYLLYAFTPFVYLHIPPYRRRRRYNLDLVVKIGHVSE